ncbi:MAG: hypothetical protein AAF830_09415 [Pseudomonadota bacterium]
MSPVILAIIAVVVVAIGLCTWKAPRLTSVIFWALIATLFLGAAGLSLLPGSFSEKALWMSIALPVLWAAVQFWTYWEKRAWVVAGGLIAVTVVCGAIIFTMEPVVG